MRRARELLGIARWVSPDVLIANNSPPANTAAYLVRGALGTPLVQYVRGPFHDSGLSRICLHRADAVFTVGPEATSRTRALGVACAQVDEGLCEDAWPTPRHPSAAPRILWCAALMRWKGVRLALEAYQLASHRTSQMLPMTLCYGPVPRALPDADELPAVLPRGVQAHALPGNLDAIRAGCNVYLHTALSPEPFGRSILEAMAAGLCPVVPSDSAALIRPGQTGLTYQSGSVADLARQLRCLARDPGLADRLGLAAARSVRNHRAAETFRPVVDRLSSLWAGGDPATDCS